METTHTHEHVTHKTENQVKSFYIFVGIISFSVIILQPLSMLIVIFVQAILQGQ